MTAGAPLSNARHEKFAQLIASGMAAGAAYAKAGYKTKTHKSRDSAGSRLLLSNVGIKARVVFLQNTVAEKTTDLLAEIAADSHITKEMVKGMLKLQARRNLGLVKVKIDRVIKTGKKKGQIETVERTMYNESAANVTLRLLGEEVGLYDAGSAGDGERQDDMAARSGLDSPEVIEALDGGRAARKLILVVGKDKEKKTA